MRLLGLLRQTIQSKVGFLGRCSFYCRRWSIGNSRVVRRKIQPEKAGYAWMCLCMPRMQNFSLGRPDVPETSLLLSSWPVFIPKQRILLLPDGFNRYWLGFTPHRLFSTIFRKFREGPAKRKGRVMFWLILSISWIIFLWDFYLNFRQYRVQKNAVKRPDKASEIISEEDYKKAREYAVDKHEFNLIYSVYSQLENTIVLFFELIFVFWKISGAANAKFGVTNEIAQSIMFASLMTVVEAILGLPWQLYETFVIEEKHGFNKQTLGFFFKDKLKKMVVMMVLMAPVLAAIVYIVQNGGPYFFVYVWLFLSLVIFILLTIYPEFIAPLFDKYVPLPESELRSKIFALAESVHFPLTKLYVVQGSKRSAHSNAYMYGFWKNKRIVLYDTLLNEENNAKLKEVLETMEDSKEKEEADKKAPAEEKKNLGMQNNEVVAVLGHELGHWALWHSICNLIISEINLLLLLAVFSYFYKAKSLYHAFGFYDSMPTVIGLIIVFQFITAPYNELISFLTTVLSRKMEFAADNYSARLGYTDELCSALIKLGKDNLSLPVDDHLYSMFNHSHPPILERIDALRKKL